MVADIPAQPFLGRIVLEMDEERIRERFVFSFRMIRETIRELGLFRARYMVWCFVRIVEQPLRKCGRKWSSFSWSSMVEDFSIT